MLGLCVIMVSIAKGSETTPTWKWENPLWIGSCTVLRKLLKSNVSFRLKSRQGYLR